MPVPSAPVCALEAPAYRRTDSTRKSSAILQHGGIEINELRLHFQQEAPTLGQTNFLGLMSALLSLPIDHTGAAFEVANGGKEFHFLLFCFLFAHMSINLSQLVMKTIVHRI